MTTSQFLEHRLGSRINLQISAELRTSRGQSAAATIRNASVSGAYVETPLRPPLLSRIAVRPLSGTIQWRDACVVRTDERGIAVEWLNLGSHAASSLLPHRAPGPLRLRDVAPQVPSPPAEDS